MTLKKSFICTLLIGTLLVIICFIAAFLRWNFNEAVNLTIWISPFLVINSLIIYIPMFFLLKKKKPISPSPEQMIFFKRSVIILLAVASVFLIAGAIVIIIENIILLKTLIFSIIYFELFFFSFFLIAYLFLWKKFYHTPDKSELSKPSVHLFLSYVFLALIVGQASTLINKDLALPAFTFVMFLGLYMRFVVRS